MSIIRIEDKKVTYVKETVEQVVTLEDFIAAISQGTPVIIPVLPNGTHGIYSYDNFTACVIEQMPRTHNMAFSYSGLHFKFQIHLPFMYYSVLVQNEPIVVQNVAITFAKKRIESLESEVGIYTFPNIQTSSPVEFKLGGYMCLGEIRVGDNRQFAPLVNDLMMKILASNFNDDYIDSGNIPEPIASAMKKYCKVEALKEAQKEKEWKEKATFLLDNRGDSILGYMYAWERLSGTITLNQFLAKIEFNQEGTYGDFLKSIAKEIKEEF